MLLRHGRCGNRIAVGASRSITGAELMREGLLQEHLRLSLKQGCCWNRSIAAAWLLLNQGCWGRGGGAAEATELLESLDRETGLLSEQGCRWSKVVAET